MKFHMLGIVGALIAHSVSICGAANILGLFITHCPSHLIVQMAVARALVERGHNVTVITSLPLNDPSPGYRHVFLKSLEKPHREVEVYGKEAADAPFHLKPLKYYKLLKFITENFANYESNEDFISFMKEDNKFDLMLLGYSYNELHLGVAAHFKCPTAVIWMMQPIGHISRLVGNPTYPSFVPFSPFMDPTPMGFFGRVINFLIHIMEYIITGTVQFLMEILYNQMYPPGKFPSFDEIKKNISVIFFNHHFSEGPVRPLLPGLIEIGGIQIKDKPDPLPKDVAKFLDASPKGAIFFSLGTNLCGQYFEEKHFKIIYNVFSKLPYNIIWKLEDNKNIPGNSSNILFNKWLPQDDILAHRNMKLFVTHAGKGSITESEYHQVPMVALPIKDDQPGNAGAMLLKGHGIVLEFRTMTEETFREAVLEVLQNETYRTNVQRFSRLYKDRPMTARETAVYWIEYVIRHKGAPHMQSPAKTLNILQVNSIDVILFLLGVLYLTFKIVKFLVVKCYSRTYSKKKNE